MSFCSLIKGITPKIRLLCFVLINSVILNFCCCCLFGSYLAATKRAQLLSGLPSACLFSSTLTTLVFDVMGDVFAAGCDADVVVVVVVEVAVQVTDGQTSVKVLYRRADQRQSININVPFRNLYYAYYILRTLYDFYLKSFHVSDIRNIYERVRNHVHFTYNNETDHTQHQPIKTNPCVSSSCPAPQCTSRCSPLSAALPPEVGRVAQNAIVLTDFTLKCANPSLPSECCAGVLRRSRVQPRSYLIVDRLYGAILRSLEQTHCARM